MKTAKKSKNQVPAEVILSRVQKRGTLLRKITQEALVRAKVHSDYWDEYGEIECGVKSVDTPKRKR